MQSIQENYRNIWQLKKQDFPIILIDVLSSSGKPTMTLIMDLQNWDFHPPHVTLLDISTRIRLSPEKVPGSIEDAKDPLGHIVFNKDKGKIWFCSPGFQEYHEHYPEDRWEHIRDTPQGKISWIVERACSLIDRQKIP